uniref:Tudor domain-containing protein n=1 Tax=Plectus sambesii TaxID=2011161 RepID=A0A914WX53_9BILA
MLLMHGPAPAEFRSPQSRSSPARSRATNEKRTAPLASSSPVRTRVSSEIQLEPGKKSPPLTTTRAFRQLQVVKHTKYSVALSHWHSLSDFFVQLGMHSKLLNELTDRLTEAFQYNYSMQRSVYSSSPMCMAKWDGDQNWYRAELLDGEGLVLFVDFGNLAVVRRRDALRDLPQLPLLIDTEALAIRCSLAGLCLLPGVDDVNDLSHPDGQSLRDWFKNSLSTCDIIFTGSVFDETRQVVLVDQADGKLLSERIARRYPHAFALEESAISLPQSLIGSECNGSAGESSSADETKSMSPSDGDRCSSQMGDEEAQEQDSDLWQFNVNDFIDAKITYLDSTKMDMAFVQPAHMIEKQASVTVACRQECSIAPQPHASAFIP